MRSRRRPPQSKERVDPLSTRVQDLEVRVRVLEAKVRELASQLRLDPSLTERTAAARATRRTRSRPRCPGCTLELPAGRRGDTCVWCGFRFDAVGGRTI